MHERPILQHYSVHQELLVIEGYSSSKCQLWLYLVQVNDMGTIVEFWQASVLLQLAIKQYL